VYNSNLPRGTSPTFTSGSNGANALIPIEKSMQIIETAIEQSVVMQFAHREDMGTQMKDLPVLSLLPSAYFVNGDAGLKQTTAAAWKNKRLVAEEIAVLIPIPNNVLMDSSIKLWDKLRPRVGEAIGRAFDAAVLFGTNKPASWVDAALGPGAISAGNTVTHGASSIDVGDDVNNVIASVANDGFMPSGMVLAPNLRYTFQGLRDSQKGLIFQPYDTGSVSTTTFGSSVNARKGMLWGMPASTTLSGIFGDEDAASANAVELFAVDWDQVYIGIRQDITVDFSNSAVITDASGAMMVNAFQQDTTIGRFVFRAAYAVPNPITRMNGTESTRWPAGVMRMAA
jgi:HK97 family phage major capsid protein